MRGSMKYLLLVAALLVGALLFAACGGDNGDDNGQGDGDPEATEPANGDSNGDANGDSGDGNGDLADFAGRFGDTEVKVTYTMTSSGDEATDFNGEMTLYWKPPDRWRMDMSSPDGDITMINTGTTTVSCFTDNGQGQCIESPLGDALGVPFLSIFTNPDGFDDFVGDTANLEVDRSTREIAGQNADCFSYAGEIEGAEGAAEVCFRSDGVLLFLSGEDVATGSVFTIEATDVSDSVSDDDLEPPYEIGSIPGLDEIPGLEDFDPNDFDPEDFN